MKIGTDLAHVRVRLYKFERLLFWEELVAIVENWTETKAQADQLPQKVRETLTRYDIDARQQFKELKRARALYLNFRRNKNNETVSERTKYPYITIRIDGYGTLTLEQFMLVKKCSKRVWKARNYLAQKKGKNTLTVRSEKQLERLQELVKASRKYFDPLYTVGHLVRPHNDDQ